MTLNDTIKTFDINKELNIFNLVAKQNDTTGARSFTFRLIKNNQIFDLTGLNIKVGGKKADGKQIFNNCKIINASKGLVELELTTQMLAAAGTLNVELIILQGNVRLSTIPFEIEIIPSVTKYSNIISSDEFGVLTDAINKADEYGEKLKEGTEKIELTYADKLNSLGSHLSENTDLLNNSLDLKDKQLFLLSKFQKKLYDKEKIIACCGGDSLTFGYLGDGVNYPTQMKNYVNSMYGEGYLNVINRGFSGDRTDQYLTRWTEPCDSDVSLIMLGKNDSIQNIDIDIFIENYRKIIERELKWGSAVIILSIPPNKNNASGFDKRYNLSIKNLATKYAIPFIDMEETLANISPDMMQSDYIHFTSKGYDYIGARLSCIFFGLGLLNSTSKINSNSSLFLREGTDPFSKFGKIVTGGNSIYPIPNFQYANGEVFTLQKGGKIVFSFFTNEDNLLCYPCIQFGAPKVKLTLDFGKDSQSFNNVFDFGLNKDGSINKKPKNSIILNKSNWGNFSYIKGIKNFSEGLFISKKGWHTITLEDVSEVASDIYFCSLDFMSYRQLENIINRNAVYTMRTNGQATQSISALDVINSLNYNENTVYASIPGYADNRPIKLVIHNFARNIAEYIILPSGGITIESGTWSIVSSKVYGDNQNDSIFLENIEYKFSTKEFLLTWKGVTNITRTFFITYL